VSHDEGRHGIIPFLFITLTLPHVHTFNRTIFNRPTTEERFNLITLHGYLHRRIIPTLTLPHVHTFNITTLNRRGLTLENITLNRGSLTLENITLNRSGLTLENITLRRGSLTLENNTLNSRFLNMRYK
jgi:hypothetical protein